MFPSPLGTQELSIRNIKTILISFLAYRIYFGGLRFAEDSWKGFAWQQGCPQVGQCLPPSPLLLRAEAGMLLENSTKAQLEGFPNFPLAFENPHLCVCMCTMGSSLADTGEGSCAGRQELLKGLRERLGGACC